jgi:hypothetical protein
MYLFLWRVKEIQEEIYKQDLLRISIMISFFLSLIFAIVFNDWSLMFYHFAILSILTLFVHLTHN